jgi:hypothetical protein
MTEYNLTISPAALAISLSRTGGQGTQGNSITSAYIDGAGNFHVVISNAADETISDTNLGGANFIATATAAANTATSAKIAAQLALDTFDDRWLGVKTSAPTLDNDGNAIVSGAIYFNSTTSNLGVWNGSSFEYPAAEAATSAAAALSSKNFAAVSEGNASSSASAALTSKNAAATSASNASGSATNSAASAANSATSAGGALSSKNQADTAAAAAVVSQNSATSSASTATTKAGEASGSAAAALVSKNAAATSASGAASSATGSASSATSALASKNSATSSASAAATSASAAAASFDSFDDRYLGAKTSNPTVDNDGNALLVGALYFNSTVSEMRVRTASTWMSTNYDSTAVDINGGTIDGTAIGNTTPANGAFTGLTSGGFSVLRTDSTLVGINGKSPALTNSNLDNTVIGGFYHGYGGLHNQASLGDNPFPSLNGAFALVVSQADIGQASEYVVQTATSFGGSPENVFRTKSTTANGWSDWGDLVNPTVNIDGGTIDGTVIGATTPAAIKGTAITGTSFASTGDMTFGDSDKALFGAGGDLQIFHDGGNSIIDETGTGDLFIRGTNINLQNRDANPNENFITCVANGAVTISHNNLTKIATTSSGVAVTGDMTFGDNGRAKFGAGEDLQIFHNGNNSYIQDLGTGSLVISSNGSAVVVNDAQSQALVNFNQNGSVYLKHVNSGVSTDRLITTSGGVSVNGNIGLTGTVDGRDLATDGAKLDAINQPLATTSSPTFNSLDISKAGAGYGSIEIGGSLGAFIDLKAPFSDDQDARIQYNAGANLTLSTLANEPIQLNHQGVTRLATTAAGVNITGTGNVTDAFNYIGSSTFYIRSRLNGGNVQIGTETPAGALYYPVTINGASDYTAFNTSTEEAMRIIAGGNVGIGTTTPTTALDVVGSVSVQSADLGTALNNTSQTLSLRADTSNTDRMLFTTRRTSAGTNWTTAAHRMQRYVDASIMGYMQFGNSNSDLITFGENNNEYMRIDGTGNVGIGTDNPQSQLEVIGKITTTGTTGTGGINLVSSNNVSNAGQKLAFYGANRSDTGEEMAYVRGLLGSDNGGAGNIQTGQLALGTSGVDRIRITGVGNVGIGTTVPTQQLEVVGRMIVDSTGIASIPAEFRTNSTTSNITFTDNATALNQVRIGSNSGSLTALAGGAERLRITATGNVGIGTTTPILPLDVDGRAVISDGSPVDENGSYTLQVQRTVSNVLKLAAGATSTSYLALGTTSDALTTAISCFNSDGALRFRTGNVDVARFLSNGNFGIGNANPTQKLEVGGNIAVTGEYVGTQAVVAGQGSGSVAMTVNDGYGNANLTFNHQAGIPDVLGNGARIAVNVDATSAPTMDFQLGSAVTAGVVYSTTSRMSLSNDGLNVTNDFTAARIRPTAADNPSSPGLQIYNELDTGFFRAGANVLGVTTGGTERMRVDSAGGVFIGSGGTGDDLNSWGYSRTGKFTQVVHATGTGGGTVFTSFKYGTSGIGSISQVGTTSVAYNTSSDYRLKENIAPIQGAADIVRAMRPATYTFKSDGTWHDGFLAHELQELHPRAVTGVKDGMKNEEYEVTPAVEATFDAEGVELTPAEDAVMGTREVPDYQGVDYSKLTPILTAALQDALRKIEVLEAQNVAFESRLSALEAATE